MEYNNYIAQLLALRIRIDARIDREIEDTMTGRGNEDVVKESIEWILKDTKFSNQKYNGRDGNNI